MGQLPGTSFQKTFHIHFVEIHVAEHFVEIRFVLRSGAGAETDGIPEIIHCKARHDSVQVDDADGFAGFIVDHDVVQLGVVVGDAQGNLFLFQETVENACQILVGEDEFDFPLNAGRPAADIIFYCFPERTESGLGIVKSRNCLVESGRRIIGQQPLKVSERQRTLVKVFRAVPLGRNWLRR